MNQSEITVQKIKSLVALGQVETFKEQAKIAEDGQSWLLDKLFIMIRSAEALAKELDIKSPKEGEPMHYYNRLQEHIKRDVFDL
jgi:hypothetical protein